MQSRIRAGFCFKEKCIIFLGLCATFVALATLYHPQLDAETFIPTFFAVIAVLFFRKARKMKARRLAMPVPIVCPSAQASQRYDAAA